MADGSGCVSGAKWCLHDTLITTHPHNPHSFDLASDYRRFDAAHAVVVDYFDPREARPQFVAGVTGAEVVDPAP